MTLKEFNPKLMEFLYFLTKNQCKMNSVQAYQKLKKSGRNISDRTIRRWFRFLDSERRMNYFMNIQRDKIGLTTALVCVKKMNPKIINIIPYLAYKVNGLSLTSLEKVCWMDYVIPTGRKKEFEEFWETAKQTGVINDYRLLFANNSFAFYAPFHESVTEEGLIRLKNENGFSDYFLKLFDKKMNSGNKSSIHPRILKNPLIVPVIFEGWGFNYSSSKIWKNLRATSQDIWKFIPQKQRKKKRDGIGTYLVKETMHEIEKYADELLHQIRVSYAPFYHGYNNGYYVLTKLKKGVSWSNFLKEIHEKSLQTVVYRCLNKSMCRLYIVTNEKKILEILHDVFPEYCDSQYKTSIVIQKLNCGEDTYSKIDWRMFDPVKKVWSYEHKRYMNALIKISKTAGHKN